MDIRALTRDFYSPLGADKIERLERFRRQLQPIFRAYLFFRFFQCVPVRQEKRDLVGYFVEVSPEVCQNSLGVVGLTKQYVQFVQQEQKVRLSSRRAQLLSQRDDIAVPLPFNPSSRKWNMPYNLFVLE